MIYRLISSRRIETHKILNLEYKPLAKSTLNENLTGVESTDTTHPYDVKLNYFMIGLRYSADMSNVVYSSAMSTLFRPAPLFSVLDNSDYDITVEGNYRLMKRKLINNKMYRFYFAKKFTSVSSVTTSLSEYNSDGSYNNLVIGDCICNALYNKEPTNNSSDIKDIVAITKVILKLELTNNDAVKANEAIERYYGGDSSIYSDGLRHCREIGLLTGMDLKRSESVNISGGGYNISGVTPKENGKPYYYYEAECCELGYIKVLDTDITIKSSNGDSNGFPLNSTNEQVIEIYLGGIDMVKVDTGNGAYRCV